MRTFVLNKLVRDKIIEKMEVAGQEVDYRQLDDDEYLSALLAKLQEEVDEVKVARNGELIGELADVLTVISALAVSRGLTLEKLLDAEADKTNKKGAFNKRYFVDRVQLKGNDPYIQYYESDKSLKG